MTGLPPTEVRSEGMGRRGGNDPQKRCRGEHEMKGSAEKGRDSRWQTQVGEGRVQRKERFG